MSQNLPNAVSQENYNLSCVVPPSLECLYNACQELYPDQSNPLQVTALVKYWLGGPDPLDYISMYSNKGDNKANIIPHWHYISFGFSDIHGDGRVHEHSGPESPSGFGFELSFRLKRELGEESPPTWPAALMQSLARYVFQSDTAICHGDHISWNMPLDGSESRIQHLLVSGDIQLNTVMTPCGSVQFLQLVGITSEELQAAQHWNGNGILEILKRNSMAGGTWLVTDMRRGESIYELDPSVSDEIEEGIEKEGSNLSGVSAKIFWKDESQNLNSEFLEKSDSLTCSQSLQKIDETVEWKSSSKVSGFEISGNLKTDKISGKCQDDVESETAEFFVTKFLDSLHITINLESGSLLPLALRGRLKHGRHFTFKSVVGTSAVTLVPPSVSGSFADANHPYSVRGPWLQVYIPDDLQSKMSKDLSVLSNPDEVSVPVCFSWLEKKLILTVVGET